MQRLARFLIGGLVAGAAGMALPAAAGATTACTIGVIPADPTPTMVVTHTAGAGEVVLRVVRLAGGGMPAIAVSDNGAAVACSGLSAAVDAVAIVRYSNSGGTSDLVVEEPQAFAPGAPPITDGQIKFIVSGGGVGRVVLRDTDGLAESYSMAGAPPGIPPFALVDVNPAGSGVNSADLGIQDPGTVRIVAEGSPQADTFIADGAAARAVPLAQPLTLRGGGGADSLTGGAAADAIDPGTGDDAVDGGAGFDKVDYSASTAGVDIDLTRTGPQGGGSLGSDTLVRVEDVVGSGLADILRGDSAANALDGGVGDDLLEGRGGNDLLTGGPGTDTASYAGATEPVAVDAARTDPQATGGAGADQFSEAFEGLVGGQAGDSLRGTAGPNTIDGGPGLDTIRALAGDDRVLLRDGTPDTADCGDDLDRAEVDPGGIDGLVGCETVVVGVAPSLPGGTGAGGAAGPGPAGAHRVAARLAGAKRQRLVGGAVALKVACPVLSCSARAAAVVALKSPGKKLRRVTLKSARARIAGGTTATLVLKLPAAGLPKVTAALAAGRHPVVRVTVLVIDAAAGKKTLRRAITLRR